MVIVDVVIVVVLVIALVIVEVVILPSLRQQHVKVKIGLVIVILFVVLVVAANNITMVSVRPLLASEHGRGGSADQGDPQPVQHQPEAFWGGRARAEPGNVLSYLIISYHILSYLIISYLRALSRTC